MEHLIPTLMSFGIPFVVWLFVLGTVVGSFLNVVVLRFEKEKTLSGRSACPHCNTQLRWYELIPIVSYLMQRGHCTTCKHHISLQYPLVETATGLMFVLVFARVFSPFPPTHPLLSFEALGTLLLHLSMWATLISITVYDLRTKLIPDLFSYTFSGLALLLVMLESVTLGDVAYTAFVAGPLLFLPFYILWKVSNGRWIGLGDGKLALGIGWLLGLELGGSAILLSFWLGAGVSLLLIALQKMFARVMPERVHGESLTLKSEIPFGPFMVIATLYTYLSGMSIFAFLW